VSHNKKRPSADSLFAQIESEVGAQKLPPLELWTPPLSGTMDLTICRNGTWMHEGEPILRPKLVSLFSSILKMEEGEYFLVSPVEKWKITVEDAPFLVESLEQRSGEDGRAIIFTTNVGDIVNLSENNPMWVEEDPSTGEPSPYVMVRKNLKALINRSVYYELVSLAIEREGNYVVESFAQDFVLGQA